MNTCFFLSSDDSLLNDYNTLNLESTYLGKFKRFLSEGNGEAARILGNRVRDLSKIESEAYRKVEKIRGVADAKATAIYSKAYNQNTKSVDFYAFIRTMQSYKYVIDKNTILVLSTDSDLFKFLKGMQ